MCVSAGISILFNQVRYEHPHQKAVSTFWLELLFYLNSKILSLRPIDPVGSGIENERSRREIQRVRNGAAVEIHRRPKP